MGVTENRLMSLGVQKENVSNKVNSPPIHDFMNERYQDIQFKSFIPKQARGGGGGICPQAGSSLCCAEMVSRRKLKLSDFYYILIGFNSEYKSVSWDIHCCHGNAIVEKCLV